MNAPRLKFSIWVIVISALSWCWASAPEWREPALLGLVFAPVFLTQRRQFVQPVDRTDIVVTLALVVAILICAAVSWMALSNKWFELSEVRPMLVLILWSAQISVGHRAFFKRSAA